MLAQIWKNRSRTVMVFRLQKGYYSKKRLRRHQESDETPRFFFWGTSLLCQTYVWLILGTATRWEDARSNCLPDFAWSLSVFFIKNSTPAQHQAQWPGKWTGSLKIVWLTHENVSNTCSLNLETSRLFLETVWYFLKWPPLFFSKNQRQKKG